MRNRRLQLINGWKQYISDFESRASFSTDDCVNRSRQEPFVDDAGIQDFKQDICVTDPTVCLRDVLRLVGKPNLSGSLVISQMSQSKTFSLENNVICDGGSAPYVIADLLESVFHSLLA